MFTKQTVFQASIILTLAVLLSRAMGFVREIVIARSFGASALYDVYLVAVTFPLVVYSLLSYAIPGVFVPVFTRAKVEVGEDRAWVYAWTFLSVFGILFFFVAAVFFAFAPQIIAKYAPALQDEQFFEAIVLLRITCIVIFIGGLFTVFKSILNANKHFLMPAISPLFLNVAIILSILLLYKSLATRALAIGLVVGHFVQLFILVWVFFKNRAAPKLILNLRDKFLRSAFSVLFFVFIIETLGQLNVVVDRSFISVLPKGGISALNYAGTIYQIAIGVFGVSVGTAIFPSVSEHVAHERWGDLIHLYSRGIRSVLVVTIPIMIGSIVFAEEIVTLVYQRGAFDQQATYLTARALQCFSIGLAAFVSHAILVKIYYAMHKELALLISTTLAFALKIALSLWLVREYRYQGLALATSFSGIFNIAMLTIYLRRKVGRLDGRRILLTLFKISFISVLCVGTAWWMMSLMSAATLVFRTVISFIVAGILFLVLTYLFKVEEVRIIIGKIKK